MRHTNRDDFFADFKQETKGMRLGFAGLAILTVLLNLALLAGAIVVVVLVLRALNVIG